MKLPSSITGVDQTDKDSAVDSLWVALGTVVVLLVFLVVGQALYLTSPRLFFVLVTFSALVFIVGTVAVVSSVLSMRKIRSSTGFAKTEIMREEQYQMLLDQIDESVESGEIDDSENNGEHKIVRSKLAEHLGED